MLIDPPHDMRAWWDERAALGENAGTQDRICKKLEMNFLRSFVEPGLRILDAGCGDGETLVTITRECEPAFALGLDFSEAMLARARARTMGQSRYRWDLAVMPQAVTDGLAGQFDLVYTERLLINLPTWDAQRLTLLRLADAVTMGGALVVVECSQDGLAGINRYRRMIDLPEIHRPAHTRYLFNHELDTVLLPGMRREAWHPFSGFYYLLSRVVHAHEARARGVEPEYHHPINDLALELAVPMDSFGWCSQVQGWVFRRERA